MIEQSGGHISGKGTRLAGKVAIVTGGGSASSLLGIGAAIALLFAAQGARVGILDLVPEHAERTRLAVKDADGEAIVVQVDVSNADACKAAIETVAAHFGQLDIVVNNAAIAQGGAIGVVSEEVWDRVIDVNLKSVMLTSTFALPHLRSSEHGSIINISSMAAVRASGAGAYAASKGGIIAMTKDMAYSFGPYGIRVNCLVPGHVYAPMGTAGVLFSIIMTPQSTSHRDRATKQTFSSSFSSIFIFFIFITLLSLLFLIRIIEWYISQLK